MSHAERSRQQPVKELPHATSSMSRGLVPGPLQLTTHLYSDPATNEIWSPHRTVEGWLQAEVALADAQAEVGLLEPRAATAIRRWASTDGLDVKRLWEETRNVGYPILPLVRNLNELLPPHAQGRAHLGATTQDIMDTGLAIQLRHTIDRLDELLRQLLRALARIVDEHQATPVAARTHGQQAVPTTVGAKLSTSMTVMMRARQRLRTVEPQACAVSLFGAGGTSAALGDHADEVRRLMAAGLGLEYRDDPWHTNRDGLASLASVLAMVSSSAVRLAREIVTLSMTEIGELSEAAGHHRGASSTMPQKANPIFSEAVIGMGIVSESLATVMFRAMEAQHERAAGEWHAEWIALPQLCCLTSGSVRVLRDAVSELRIDAERMRTNLALDSGLIMAEGYMMRLADQLGRERAHDLVYAAVQQVRAHGGQLHEAIGAMATDAGLSPDAHHPRIEPHDYLGSAVKIARQTIDQFYRFEQQGESHE